MVSHGVQMVFPPRLSERVLGEACEVFCWRDPENCRDPQTGRPVVPSDASLLGHTLCCHREVPVTVPGTASCTTAS